MRPERPADPRRCWWCGNAGAVRQVGGVLLGSTEARIDLARRGGCVVVCDVRCEREACEFVAVEERRAIEG